MIEIWNHGNKHSVLCPYLPAAGSTTLGVDLGAKKGDQCDFQIVTFTRQQVDGGGHVIIIGN